MVFGYRYVLKRFEMGDGSVWANGIPGTIED